MATADKILHEALALDADERARVAHKLLLSLEPGELDPEADEAWAHEIRARLNAIRDGSVSMRDWEDALTDIRAAVQSRSKK